MRCPEGGFPQATLGASFPQEGQGTPVPPELAQKGTLPLGSCLLASVVTACMHVLGADTESKTAVWPDVCLNARCVSSSLGVQRPPLFSGAESTSGKPAFSGDLAFSTLELGGGTLLSSPGTPRPRDLRVADSPEVLRHGVCGGRAGCSELPAAWPYRPLGQATEGEGMAER